MTLIRSRGRTLGGVGFLALLLTLTLAACDEAQQAGGPAAAPPPAVTVQPVERREILETVEFLGKVDAIDRVELRARVQGELMERRFTEGAAVQQGQIVFIIDPAPFQASVDLAQANLSSAQAVQVETAAALARAETLIARGNISEAALDEARAAALQADASVQARQAEIATAEIQLGYTRIIAPIAGLMGRSEFSVGNLIGPESDVLATVTSMDPIYVLFTVSERDIVTWRQQAVAEQQEQHLGDIRVRLRLNNGTLFEQEGQLNFVASEVDATTGTVEVRAEFPNPNRILLPDQFVTVLISGQEPEDRLVVPQAAIQQDQQGRFVLSVDADNLVQVRRVTMGTRDGSDWVVEGGLDEGELIIVEGMQRVRPGAEVTPTGTGAQAGTPG